MNFPPPIQEHMSSCQVCQQVLTRLSKIENQIYEYEKYQENALLLEVFDTIAQKRVVWPLSWQQANLGWQGEELCVLPSSTAVRDTLEFSFRYLWYGQLAVYLKNNDFPLAVTIQRGKRFLKLALWQQRRLIKGDAILLYSGSKPVIKLSLSIPVFLQEKSTTRKFRSLAQVTPSFIQSFFSSQDNRSSPIVAWKKVKKGLSGKELSLYLAHLNEPSSYREIAIKFRVLPADVAGTFSKIRAKLLKLCSGK